MTGLDPFSKETNTLYFTLCDKKEGKKTPPQPVLCFTALRKTICAKSHCVFHALTSFLQRKSHCRVNFIIPHFMLCCELEAFTGYTMRWPSGFTFVNERKFGKMMKDKVCGCFSGGGGVVSVIHPQHIKCSEVIAHSLSWF